MTSDPTTRRHLRAERDARIIHAWLNGATLDQLAATHGISRTRIGQIIHQHPDLATEREHRLKALHAQQRAQVLQWSADNVGAPIDDAAAALGLTPAQVSAHLGVRITLHQPAQPPTSSRRPRWSDDELLAALTLFTSTGGRRRSDYDTWRTSAHPSSSVIITRLGSWSQAIALGQGHPAPPTPRRPRWSDTDLADWARHYFTDTPGPWTLRGLDRWLATQPEAPSIGAVRLRWSRWEQIRQVGLGLELVPGSR